VDSLLRAVCQIIFHHHVQAIIVSIDQCAESALGNREYFLNRCNRLVLPGLSNAADHLPRKPDPAAASLVEQAVKATWRGRSVNIGSPAALAPSARQ
jgi:hypothetical protein